MTDHNTYRVMAHRIRMFVRDWPGDSPPILFLHHFTGNSIQALRLARLLNGRRRLIAPDLRGRGKTDMPFGEYGIQAHLREIVGCLDRLKIGRCVVAGHSFGANLAVFLAAQHPQRVSGLILYDGGAFPSQAARQLLNFYYDNLQYKYPSLEDYIERYRSQPIYQPWTEELELLVRSNLHRQPDGTYIRNIARFVIDSDRRNEHIESWRRLEDMHPQIACPVLVLRAGLGITGPNDQVLDDATLEVMQNGMPHAEIVTIPQAGHTTIVTMPSPERDAAIERFLGVT
jgi:pimeloyl-ACP methyl ester carboxylesterase